MDNLSPRKRSYTMSRIRSKDTIIEKLVFKALKNNKLRFRKHYSKLPGKPDIVHLEKKVAIFIDGDFWHGWKFTKWKERIPKNYWQAKIQNNIIRDKRNRLRLKSQGWKVLRIWEHQLEKNLDASIKKIIDFLSQ